MSQKSEKEKMLNGEMYFAFSPELVKDRTRAASACNQLNNEGDLSRRKMVKHWRNIQLDTRPLPPEKTDEDEDAAQFENDPWITPPVRMDYGYNVKCGKNVYFNFGCTFIDGRLITFGSRTLVGPACSFYTGSHPLDPKVRDGTNGPEYGKEIHIGEDCWIGGNVIILPGITVGDGAIIGAGSVVTKDVPSFHMVAGNPARIIKEIPRHTETDATSSSNAPPNVGTEVPMARMAEQLEDGSRF